MPAANNMSLPERMRATARLATRAAALLGFVLSGRVTADELPVIVEYQSAIAGYRHFDAKAPAIDWRDANDAIRDGAEDGAHGLHDMSMSMEALPPVTQGASPPASPVEPRARSQ